MAKPNVVSREELIKSAKECLVENGIEKFTLKAVADRGGVTQGTVYYHFRTKEQLLIDIVKDICGSSWNDLSQTNGNLIKEALESAKGRCGEDSLVHKLFFTLMVMGFNNDKIREQLGDVLVKENKELSDNLSKVWSQSPIEGVSLDTWGVLFNALVDGLAIQALMVKDFPVETVYEGFEKLISTLSNVTIQEEDK